MTTIITNTIEPTKLLVNFNFQDGSLSFTSIEINTEGDIDFNPLILKLAELIEYNRQLEVEYEDVELLAESNSKIGLVKATLNEIYMKFNANIEVEAEQPTDEDLEIETEE